MSDFKQKLFSQTKYVNITEGDNFLRLMPHKQFDNPHAQWYVYRRAYRYSSTYANNLAYTGDEVYHDSCDGQSHNKSGVYDRSGNSDLIAIYNRFVSDYIAKKYVDTTSKERKDFFKNYFLFKQKRVHFYACKYENGYSEDEIPIISLLELPAYTFEKVIIPFIERIMDGGENKGTHPDGSYIFNIHRADGPPMTYIPDVVRVKQKVGGKTSELRLENKLTEGQLEELQELPAISTRFDGAYDKKQFSLQFDFLKWYDEHVFRHVTGEKSIIDRKEFKEGWIALKNKLEEEQRITQDQQEAKSQSASVTTAPAKDEDDLPF